MSTTVIETTFTMEHSSAYMCPSHARAMLELLYDFPSNNDTGAISKACTRSNPLLSFLPAGHSTLWSCVQNDSDNSDDEEDTENSCDSTDDDDASHKCATETDDSSSEDDDANQVLFNLDSSIEFGTSMSSPMKNVGGGRNGLVKAGSFAILLHANFTNPFNADSRISEANEKWAKHYKGNCDFSQTPENTFTSVSNNPRRKAHFPQGNPVTAVYHLLRYATACRLERRDRIWDRAARERFVDLCRKMISEGKDPSTIDFTSYEECDDS